MMQPRAGSADHRDALSVTGDRTGPPTGEDAPAADPRALIRTRQYRIMLVFAALIGLLVSAVSWGYLELVHYIQTWVYEALPQDLGYTTLTPGDLGHSTIPWWYPLPWLALAGVLTALAITRFPGGGGHVPADGLATGGAPTRPIELPGVVLAAFATLGLGLVLGPEAPLIAIGMGLGMLAVQLIRRDAPDQTLSLMAITGGFAAISSLFGSPVVGAVIMIEAAGLGGAMLPVILVPGLLAAGVGGLVFTGLGSWSGFSTTAYALSPIALPAVSKPGWGDVGWTVALALAAALVTFALVELARWTKRVVETRPVVLTTAAALVVGGLAIAFNQATDQPMTAVLFSGQNAFGDLAKSESTLSLWTLALLILFKGLAWGISLGNFRGGPAFPALFLGASAGVLAAHLPGLAQTPAVAALMAAGCAAVLRLPLSSVVITLVLVSQAGVGVTSLIVVAAVVAFVTVEALDAVRDRLASARRQSRNQLETSLSAR
jgi:chloride channel protein, CIC family